MIATFIRRAVTFILSRYYQGRFEMRGNRPRINRPCVFKAPLVVGNNVNFNGAKIYGMGTVYIGDNFHSARNLVIFTLNHNYKGSKIPYDESVIVKDVTIGDNVWIGWGVIVLPGVSIGEGAIIQAGSVVSSSIPRLAIAGGNPCRVIRYRDAAHYEKLKSSGAVF